MARREELTDEQWALLSPLIPPMLVRADGKGCPGSMMTDQYSTRIMGITYRRSLDGFTRSLPLGLNLLS